MSINRLCVFNSNCSRLFLSMCGLRSTVQSCRLVGRGIGPETCAPVFSAVRTISAAAWSISAWSNAFSRMRILPAMGSSLLQDLGDDAGADGAAALADREAQLLLHRDRRDQLDRHLRVVPRHHHLHPCRQLHRPRHVRRPEVKLRPIPLEKRRVPPSLFLRQHVHFTLKLRVRRDRPRLRQHHPPLHLVLLHPPQQQPHIVPRLPLIQQLAEHLHTRHHRLLVRPKPHHLHFLPHLHLPPIDPPRRHRPPPRDRKHVLHRPQERLLHLPLPPPDALVHPRLRPLDRLQGRPPDHRHVVPRKLVLRQQLPHL